MQRKPLCNRSLLCRHNDVSLRYFIVEEAREFQELLTVIHFSGGYAQAAARSYKNFCGPFMKESSIGKILEAARKSYMMGKPFRMVLVSMLFCLRLSSQV